MCVLEISNLLAARMFSIRCKLRARLRSLPKYIRPYCFIFRRILGGLGLYVGLTTLLALCWYTSFQKPNLQVFGVVVCFQLIVMGWAAGFLRILTWLFECLHANMIVYLISSIYLVQVSYMLLHLDDSQFILRGTISYAVTSLFFPYVIFQLPVWKRKLLLGTFYWSSVSQVTFSIGATAYLIQFLLQNPCSQTSPSTPQSASLLCANSFGYSNVGSLNWIFLNDLTLLKTVTLFSFQAMAYHVASQEEFARNSRPVPMNRRCG